MKAGNNQQDYFMINFKQVYPKAFSRLRRDVFDWIIS